MFVHSKRQIEEGDDKSWGGVHYCGDINFLHYSEGIHALVLASRILDKVINHRSLVANDFAFFVVCAWLTLNLTPKLI